MACGLFGLTLSTILNLLKMVLIIMLGQIRCSLCDIIYLSSRTDPLLLLPQRNCIWLAGVVRQLLHLIEPSICNHGAFWTWRLSSSKLIKLYDIKNWGKRFYSFWKLKNRCTTSHNIAFYSLPKTRKSYFRRGLKLIQKLSDFNFLYIF